MAELRKTPLNAVHRESGARMVPFGGWDMPVEYSGLIAEHNAVRTAAGLFDVSHMGQFEVEGEGALAFLQRMTANNVAKLVDGQAQYSALPMPTGLPGGRHHRLPPLRAPLPRRGQRREHREGLAAGCSPRSPSGCGLHDLSDQFALLALQGPKAAAILQGLTPIDLATGRLLPLRRGDGGRLPRPSWPAPGYTGEDGFEIFVAPEAAPALWRRARRGGPAPRPRCPPASGRATRCASRPG